MLPGGNKSLAGVIDRARLYDRALTADEVAASASRRRDLVPGAGDPAELVDRTSKLGANDSRPS